MTELPTTSNGGWVQTIVGMLAAVVTTFTLIYILTVPPLTMVPLIADQVSYWS